MSHLSAFMPHAIAAKQAAAALGLHACIQLSDFQLRLSDGRLSQSWKARFISDLGGRLGYTDSRSGTTVGFAGWMPYPIRQWPVATDKIAFKRRAIASGIATPPACFDPARIGGPFLVKPSSSSFGHGIRGPFLAYEAGNPAHQLAPGEYYENFIVGHIAKAWCWGGECLALHLHPPSTVCGDGRSSLRQLVQALPNSAGGAHDWDLLGRLAAYCGVASLDAVPREGKEVLVEFRYGSRYDPPSTENQNVLDRIRDHPLAAQFLQAAHSVADAISLAPEQRNSCYTLDAIVDVDGQALFLEMNCNPVVHPDLYGAMMASCFGLTQTGAAPPGAAPPRVQDPGPTCSSSHALNEVSAARSGCSGWTR